MCTNTIESLHPLCSDSVSLTHTSVSSSTMRNCNYKTFALDFLRTMNNVEYLYVPLALSCSRALVIVSLTEQPTACWTLHRLLGSS